MSLRTQTAIIEISQVCPHLHGDQPEARIFVMDIKSLPRMHGDEPAQKQPVNAKTKSAPCIRGWTHANRKDYELFFVCAVCAGMNQTRDDFGMTVTYLPRVYGDDPSSQWFWNGGYVFAPYIRGYLHSQKKHHSMGRHKATSMTPATKNTAPELPYLEQDGSIRGRSSVLFVFFLPKSVVRKKSTPNRGHANETRLYGIGEGMDYHKTVRCKLSQHSAGLVYI